MDGIVQKTTEAPPPTVEAARREVIAYVSIFGNLDSVGDIVEAGAFDTSRVDKGLVPVKHNHETIVGKTLAAGQDSTGLWTAQKFRMDPTSDRIFGMVADGTISTYSFKARIPKGGQAKRKGADGVTANYLSKMVLYEAGPADPDLAVNDQTYTVSAKAMADLGSLVDALDGLRVGRGEFTDEEREALRSFVAGLPLVGKCLSSFLTDSEVPAEAVVDETEAITGKAMQLNEAIEAWQVEQIAGRLAAINRRLSAAN